MTKKQKRRNASKRSKEKRVSAALKKWLKAKNPAHRIGMGRVRYHGKVRTLPVRLKRNRGRNVAAGFYDEDGIFHPIRASYDYSSGRAGDRSKPAKKKRRKK